MPTPFRTDQADATVAEATTIAGANGDSIGAYVARPITPGPHGAVVFIHHGPGFDDWSHEVALKFARKGYITVMPHLYHRFGPGTVEEVAARRTAAGGVADDQVVGDIQGAINYIRTIDGHNGKVGVIGPCSGGRQAFLVGTSIPDEVNAVVDLWGGGVVLTPEERTPMRPTSLVDNTAALTAPLLGLFGNDDANPNPEMVNTMEAALQAAGKDYEFHRYDGAGHAFLCYDRPSYRQEQAMDGWSRVWDFFEKHLT